MVAYVFDRILQRGATEAPQRVEAARQWYRNAARRTTVNPDSLIRSDRERFRIRPTLGEMYVFNYDPKFKEVLPYYDRFPLVIPIERYNDGFLGLNLHYIHPKQRMILLDKLSDTMSNDTYDENTKLKISYRYLAAASKIFEANACIKRYLFSHVDSRFLEITADEWDIAATLPVETFVGARTSKVYADSRKKF